MNYRERRIAAMKGVQPRSKKEYHLAVDRFVTMFKDHYKIVNVRYIKKGLKKIGVVISFKADGLTYITSSVCVGSDKFDKTLGWFYALTRQASSLNSFYGLRDQFPKAAQETMMEVVNYLRNAPHA